MLTPAAPASPVRHSLSEGLKHPPPAPGWASGTSVGRTREGSENWAGIQETWGQVLPLLLTGCVT